jgi:IS5 family transposase
MQQLERMSASQRQTQQVPKYRELLRITEQMLENARQVVKKTAKVKGIDVIRRAGIDELCRQITTYCDLGGKVIDQTRRRVLDGEQVPVEVFLAESSEGLITDYQVLDGNPADTNQVKPSLDRHQQVFQHGPELYAGDRGFHSAENEEHCQQAGVSQVCIPQRGGQKTVEREALERSRAFKKGQRFGWASRVASRFCFVAGDEAMPGQRTQAIRGSGGRRSAG